MKLLVIGATGPTGQCVVKEALVRGHEVIALVRNPDKLTTKNDKLQVVTGDIMSVDDVTAQVKGCDAVLSAVGGRGGMFTPCDVYSRSSRAVVEAMRRTGITRYVVVTAWGVKDDPRLSFIWRWVLKPTILRNVVSDMEQAETYVSTQCDDVNYTVVRPPRLTNAPSQGGEIQTCVNQLVPDAKPEIGRPDLARFILDCLGTTQYDRTIIAVAGPKQVEELK